MNEVEQDCWLLLQPSDVAFPFSWVGHIPFAMWLVCQLKPSTFVELGTHSGNSYLAICQSVKQHQLPTRCYAVDTWQGDEHAGQYDNSVYETLQLQHNKRYGSFSTLLRMTFDDALQRFDDNTIDLLHIDGLHTYEAVKHDFETWLPKMTANGIILFHDIAVHERGFGVFQFWQELQKVYPFTISFDHSNGLGVLFLQQPTEAELTAMLDMNNTEAHPLKQRFQTLGNQVTFHAALSNIRPVLSAFESQSTTLAQLYDSLVHEYNLLQNKSAQSYIQLTSDNTRHTADNVKLSAEVNKLVQDHHELNKLKASRSWRITAPLRWGVQQLRETPLLSFWQLSKNISNQLKRYGLSVTAKRLYHILVEEGLSGIVKRIQQRLKQSPIVQYHISEDKYIQWITQYERPLSMQQVDDMLKNMTTKPVVSVVMPVYNPPLALLKAAVLSVTQQSYPHWQLCIADDVSPNPEVRDYLTQLAKQDTRINVLLRTENGHISAASNSALTLATGEYVALLDHDDLLAKDALLWIADSINKHPNAMIIYSDEDKINEAGKRFDPYFKSDWNLELFLSQNMISHLGIYQRDLLVQIGGFRIGYEGSQDYDLALRCLLKIDATHIVHIPKVLYHWRVLPGSTAMALDEKPYAQIAGEDALNDYLTESGLGGYATSLPQGGYRIHAPLPERPPLVSLIIPTRNGEQLVKECIESILEKTTYTNYEILLIDNGSDDASALAYFTKLNKHPLIRVIRDDRPFNYSALNNAAVEQASGSIIGLINNDIEVITPGWLEEMISLVLRPCVGAVGAKLWYPDNRLQHGGVIVGLGGVAGHAHYLINKNNAGYFGRASLTQQFSAVTAACLLVTKAAYHAVGGLDETNLSVAFNDVDFCLKLQEAGYRNVWTPFAEFYHHESISRGLDDTPEKRTRFLSEVAYMEQRWKSIIAKDPYYNPNLSLTTIEQFQVKVH